MIDTLMNFNPVIGIIVFVIILILFGFIPYLLGRLLIARHTDRKSEDVAVLLFRAVGILLGLMLSLNFVETRSAYVKIQESVELEAKEISELADDLKRFGTSESMLLLDKLAEYTKTVIQEEWPDLAAGRHYEKAQELFDEIENGILALRTDSQNQNILKNMLLKDVDEIANHRATRIFAGNVNIKWFLSVVLIGFLISTFLLSYTQLGFLL